MMKPNDITSTKSSQVTSEKEGVDTGTSPVAPKTPKGHDPEKFRQLLDDEAGKRKDKSGQIALEEEGESSLSLFAIAGAMKSPVKPLKDLPATPPQMKESVAQVADAEPTAAENKASPIPSDAILPSTTEGMTLKEVKPLQKKAFGGDSKSENTPSTSAEVAMSVEQPDLKKPIREAPTGEGFHQERPSVQKVKEKSGADTAGLQQSLTAMNQQPVTVEMIAPKLATAPTAHVDLRSRVEVIESIEALAKQMVDAITTATTKETTTTTIALKYPPLFEGASIEITQYSQSPKDLNVTFYNLTPDARVLIEMGDNQAMLRQNLIDKGYTLQLLTIESDVRSDRGGIITAKSDAETRGGQGDRFGSKKEGDRGKEDNRFG